MHQVLPELGALLPSLGVFFGVDDGHDAVSDKDHGGEVLGAGGARNQHEVFERVSTGAVA